MFYATETKTAHNYSENHVLKFYTKANRDAYCAKSKATAITAQQAKKHSNTMRFNGYTATDKEVDCVYFGVIIAK